MGDRESSECDLERKGSVPAEEIFSSADRFGVRTCVVRIPKPDEHTAILEQQINSALQPLLSGDRDVVLVSLMDFEAGADIVHLLILIDAKIQQLVQDGASVIVAEDWDELNGTAASIVLCTPKLSGGTSAGVLLAGQHDVWEIAFN